MTLKAAFALLQLNPNATRREVTSTYHRLAKRWHPDNNPDNPTLNTEMMHLINLAHRLIEDSLDSDHTEPPDPQNIPRRHTLYLDAILDAIFLYYQYGLENIHLRTQGVGRFHYKSALRKLTAAIAKLENHLRTTQPKHSSIVLFLDFAKGFLDNMRIDKYFIPTVSERELKSYRHYHNGSSRLDTAIKHILFPELFRSKVERLSNPDDIETGQREFVVLLTNFGDTTWVAETTIKLNLLERFRTVLPLLLNRDQ